MVVWRGVQGGCGVRCPGRVWGVFFFKSAIELIQINCLLLILHSAGGWCLVMIHRCILFITTLKQNHWKIIGSFFNNSSLLL